CPVCLGRHPHRIIDCRATKTWDDVFDTLCTHINRALVMRDKRPICNDWQRETKCSSTSHDGHHICSGCGASSHGAQTCPRAQK
ncbi:hypothetical protein BDN67DRAFT_862885, partial [Paxillus ammoniavirescens]